MSGNQWGPPPGQQYPPAHPPAHPPVQPGQYAPQYPPQPPSAQFQPPYQPPYQPQYPRPQQQFGWGAPPGPPRPPKKSGRGGVIAAFVLLGVLVAGVVGLKVVSAVLKGDGGDPSYASPTTTSSYSPSQSPTYRPTNEPSTRTTARPTSRRTTQPPRPTTRRTTTQPTVKPTQKAGPTDSDLVVKNRLYKAGTMASVKCKESSARQSTAAGARANYKNLLGCLNKAWAPVVARAGGKLRSPQVVTFSGTVSSPCGSHSDTGPPFFCGSNDTIYMNLSEDMGNYNRYRESYQKIWARMWMLHQFAHEYGHHVQSTMGILSAYARIRYERPTYAKELEDSRRLELQASCFSDIFISANRKTYPVTGQALYQWRWLIGHVTDLQNDHGDPNNHQYWATRGWNSRNPSVCNTWVAPAAKVK